MSDGPTHFKNKTIRIVPNCLKVSQKLTVYYCPWSNSAVELIGKQLLRVFRSVISEMKMRPEKWPDILPIVQSALNNAPSLQRKMSLLVHLLLVSILLQRFQRF